MIDPKLNEIPVEASDELLTEEQRATKSASKPRAGLSINDTVAGTANLSVGARGVETSGVSAGAGVGAGMTHVSPGGSAESPAPEVIPGSRGSGTTVRGLSDKLPPTSAMPDSSGTIASHEGSETAYTDQELAAEAHRCWHERGCPEGSPEVDWHTARERLRARKASA
ncbi:MAG: DUF2934 domain-containing protein [Acidobacteriaceae bacterium]|nr:DUF2934 domain-containing protein [Acidobacteriaceae bacterium]